jgi:hypothetical protein
MKAKMITQAWCPNMALLALLKIKGAPELSVLS